jgi:hypothetical protein
MNILPTIRHKKTTYFVDVRLEEIRDINDPFKRMSFGNIPDIELAEKVAQIWARCFETITTN